MPAPRDKIDELDAWDNHQKAEALFFKDKFGKPAFRLEVPDLSLEFTDGFYIGSDPAGTLYFTNDFNNIIRQSTKAKYTVDSIIVRQKVWVNVKFYRQNSRPVDPPFAEFMAEDPQRLGANSGLVGLTDRTGDWKKQDYIRSSAVVEKAAGSNRITLTCRGMHKKAELTVDSSSFRSQTERIKVNGILSVKDTETIDSAHFARWYSDHIVFYDNDYTGKDFTGFFFPLEYKQSNDETNLGSERDRIFNGVKWSHA